MNGTKVFFDTCAVIKLLEKQYDLSSAGINVEDSQFFTSVIVRIELLSKRQMKEEEELKILDFMDDLTIVSINEPIERQAIALRRNTQLKLPDCIIAATSIMLDAVLLTDDHHLLNISWPGLRTQNIR